MVDKSNDILRKILGIDKDKLADLLQGTFRLETNMVNFQKSLICTGKATEEH